MAWASVDVGVYGFWARSARGEGEGVDSVFRALLLGYGEKVGKRQGDIRHKRL
jgi:hypothetical protein